MLEWNNNSPHSAQVEEQLSIFCSVQDDFPYSAKCTGTTFHILHCTGTTFHILHSVQEQLSIFCTVYRNNFPYSAQCTGTTFYILHSVQEQLSIFCTVYRNNFAHSAQCTGTTTVMFRVSGKLILKNIIAGNFSFIFVKQTIPS